MEKRKAGEEGGAGVEASVVTTTNWSRVSSDLPRQEEEEVLLEEPEDSEEKSNSLSLESSYFLFFYFLFFIFYFSFSTSNSLTPQFKAQEMLGYTF